MPPGRNTLKTASLGVPAQGQVIGARFADILKGSTAADLRQMAILHRRYSPDIDLPAELRRAIREGRDYG